ncbi:MAG: S41 family peptidase [Bacilli bacterium]|nr:S41 family peptidase [Bacilli bacterium]MBP3635458.1 S41 family peptidase [Bacilli bacterium]
MEKKKIQNCIRIAIIVVLSMMIGSAITMFIKTDYKVEKKVSLNNKYSEFEPLYEAYDAIMKNYYDDVSSKNLIDGALNGMLESLNDKHSMYFDKQSKEEFDAELSGTYYGIGAQIQLTSDGNVKIVKIFDDSPAQKAGLKVNDIFVSVDGESTEGMNATDVASKLKSTDVKKSKIIVNRDGENIEFNVIKENVTLFSVSSEMLKSSNKNIGYIGVSIFGQKTYTQFYDALTKLEKQDMDSLIIDLRGNTGGYLYTVTNMLELFIDKGNVIYKMQTNEGITDYKTTTSKSKNYKVVILIDESSASASEIMAAAMKEKYSAVLVGKTTYGKGTVQTTKELSNGAMIKYTIEKWLTPSGKNIDGEGIKPDYEVDMTDEYTNNPSNENDVQLQKALELLK